MVKIILISLAVWRISSLVANEEGPFDMFARLRNKLGVRYDESSNIYGTNWFSKGLICMWCNSIWFSAIGALYTAQSFVEWIIHTLAISTLAIIVDRMV